MPDEPAQSPFWPADNAAVTAHIGLLQDIISRMANNSASCKTWCLALVGALLGLAGAVHSPAVVAFAVVAVVVFGFVDTMYLAQEKAYRSPYRVEFTLPAAELVGDLERTERGDPRMEAEIPFPHWYTPRTLERCHSWGPHPRDYPAPAGLEHRMLV